MMKKGKTLDLCQDSHPIKQKRKWRDYQDCINSPKCNKIMSWTFGALILGLFLGIVTMTFYQTDFAAHDGRNLARQPCNCCEEQNSPQIAKLIDDVDVETTPAQICIEKACKVTCNQVLEDDLTMEILNALQDGSQCIIIELELIGCKFNDDNMSEKWLSDLKLQVRKLDIIKSNLTHILPDAFNSDVFKGSLSSLSIDNDLNNANDPFVYQMVSKVSFKGLTKLASLTITGIPSLSVLDKAALDHLVDSLTQLFIVRVANHWSPNGLFSSTKFKQLSYVDLQSNNFKSLNSSSFRSLTDSAETLVLSNSQIESIAVDTFANFKVLRALYMHSNLLTTIPPEVFDKLFPINGFSFTLYGNKFICDCELLDVKNMLSLHQIYIYGTVKCAEPENVAGLEIIEAEICQEETEETQETTLTLSAASSLGITINCSRFPNVPRCQTTVSPKTESTLRPTIESTESTTSTTETPPDPPTDSPTDPPTETTTNPPTDPSTDSPTIPPTEPPTNPPTDLTTETTTNPPTDPPTVSPTIPPTEPPTEPPTNPPTEPPTESTTNPPTDPPTKPPTNPPTTPPTDAPTDPPTDATESSTTPRNEPTTTSTTTNHTTTQLTDPPTTTELITSEHTTHNPADTSTIFQSSTSKYPNTFEIDISCYRDSTSRIISNSSNEYINRIGRYLPNIDSTTLKLQRPSVTFRIRDGESESVVQIDFDNIYNHDMIFLIYYPGFFDATDVNEDNSSTVNCRIVGNSKIFIADLLPTTVYTFCALIRNVTIQTPFQCKSYQTPTPFRHQTWIYQEQKTIILTSFMLLIMLSLIVGIVLTYLTIRRMPTLMRGSKRVVLVNNRTKEVMVMPGGSRNNSWQKESATPIKAEAPTYLTPLPRPSFDHSRPPFVRSSSDTSLRSARSYVSVSRAPPRFSQVFLPSDFKHELPRRCGSSPNAPCYSPDPIPPPLPRRSIASTASTLEMRKPSNNSIYRRQPSRIEDETENHYNFII